MYLPSPRFIAAGLGAVVALAPGFGGLYLFRCMGFYWIARAIELRVRIGGEHTFRRVVRVKTDGRQESVVHCLYTLANIPVPYGM